MTGEGLTATTASLHSVIFLKSLGIIDIHGQKIITTCLFPRLCIALHRECSLSQYLRLQSLAGQDTWFINSQLSHFVQHVPALAASAQCRNWYDHMQHSCATVLQATSHSYGASQNINQFQSHRQMDSTWSQHVASLPSAAQCGPLQYRTLGCKNQFKMR